MPKVAVRKARPAPLTSVGMWHRISAALVVALTACTAQTADTTTATETSIQSETTTTAGSQIVDGGLIRVDQATLIPLPDAVTLVKGNQHEGVVSADGTIVAVKSRTGEDQFTVTVIDLADDNVITSADPGLVPSGLRVSDDGTANWLAGEPFLRLFELTAGAQTARLIHDSFPDQIHVLGAHIEVLGPGRFGFVGEKKSDDGTHSTLIVLTVDTEAGTTELTLPIESALVSESGMVDRRLPAVVWASPDRVLIVDATSNRVLDVMPSTGEVVERAFDGGVAPGPGTTRQAFLSPDGALLYVATTTETTDVSVTTAVPGPLIVLDTAPWEDIAAEPLVVDSLFPSPDGSHLLARRTEVRSTEGETTREPSALYLIETADAKVVATFPHEGDNQPGPVQYSADGAFAYVETVTDAGDKLEILDLTGLQFTGAVEFRGISLIGRAGLIAFHVRP